MSGRGRVGDGIVGGSYKVIGRMERIPVGEGYNAVAFARSDAAKAMVQGGVDHFLNPMNAIEEAATRQKGEIDKALSILRNLPVTRISAYVEKHPELKKLLGLV